MTLLSPGDRFPTLDVCRSPEEKPSPCPTR